VTIRIKEQIEMSVKTAQQYIALGTLGAFIVLALCVWTERESHAQSATGTASSVVQAVPETVIDPDKIVRGMASLLTSAQSLTLHIEKSFDVVLEDGAKIQYSGAADIALRRPDRIYVMYGDDVSAKELWYDGSTFTLFDLLHNVYGSIATAPHIDAALEQLSADYGIRIPLAPLFSADPYAKYAAGARNKRYFGLHDVEGIASHHFLFRGDHLDWQIWIEAGERPLPRKIVVTYKELDGSPQHSIVLTEWDLDAELDDELFVADVPDGSVKADFSVARKHEQ
jgi:hypothetical protein